MSLVDEPLTLPIPAICAGRENDEALLPASLPEVEHDMVRKMLERTDWNVTKSARLLGLSRDMLRYRIEKLRLTRTGKLSCG